MLASLTKIKERQIFTEIIVDKWILTRHLFVKTTFTRAKQGLIKSVNVKAEVETVEVKPIFLRERKC